MALKYFEVMFASGGKPVKTVVKANTKFDAIGMVKSSGAAKVIRAKEIAPSLQMKLDELKAEAKSRLSPSKVKLQSLIAALSQIAVMANAGISFTDILQESVEATADPRLKKILAQCQADINSGFSFSQALAPYKDEIGSIVISMVELGEKTGAMAESLSSLVAILEEIADNRAKLKKALRYPTITIIAMAIAFTVLILLVVPKFKGIFEKFGAALPLPTKILLNIEYFLTNYGLFALAAIVGIFMIISHFYKNNEKFRLSFDTHVLKIFLIGHIINLSMISRFTIVFKELTKAGLPITDALRTGIGSIENLYLKQQLTTVIASVQKGNSITKAFSDSGVYEKMLLQMINAGEQSGSLGAMLDRTADYLRIKLRQRMDGITASIEPIMIAFIACFVLLLALGIFMPMWDMAKVAKGG